MKININLANNLKQSAVLTLNKIKHSIDQLHYVVVPDRFSVTVEKQILKRLNRNCCFNIEVLPLSRLCNRYIKDENKKLLTKNQSIMLIKKCILKHHDKLLCFKNSSKTDNFSESIFETIMQLKSCNITPDELTTDNLEIKSLQLKLNDIKIIYEEYEKYLKNNYVDSFNKLNLFCENMYKYAELKQFNIHFVYFNSFTPLILKVINNLIRNSKSVNFGLCVANNNQKNNHIYSNQAFEDIMMEARALDITPTIDTVEPQNGIQNFLQENLYAYADSTFKSNAMAPLLANFTCPQNEVEYICADIKRKVIQNNLRYNKFVIACANAEQYFDLFKTQLSKFNMPYHIDLSQKLSKTVIWNLLDNCINSYLTGDNKVYLINIVDNPILKFNSNSVNIFKNFCDKYNIKNNLNVKLKLGQADNNYQISEEIRQNLFSFISLFDELKTCKIAQDFSNNVLNIIQNNYFIDLYNAFINELFALDKYQYEIEKQALNKISEVLKDISEILSDNEISLKEWYQILLSGIQSTNISVLPLSVDCVFVGDINNSVFDNADYLYICGATQHQFPTIKQDVGVISDFEIEKLNKKMFIEPTIRTINQRTRLKCIELVSNYNVCLTMTYSVLDMSANTCTASEIMKQISKLIYIYNHNVQSFMPIAILCEEELNNFVQSQQLSNLCHKYVNENNALKYIVNSIKENLPINLIDNFEEKQILYNYLVKSNKNTCVYTDIINNNNDFFIAEQLLFFKNNNTSISEIECYFNCPFKHFLKYGLRLQEKQDSTQLGRDIGNILHSVAEKYVKYELNNHFIVNIDNIKLLSEKLFNQSIKENRLEHVAENIENQYLIKDLIQESERLCVYLHNSINKTKYKPTLVEQNFGEFNSKCKEILIKSNNLSYKITGKIDRVDMYNGNFRIIDYKTGSTTFNLEQLYYGEKIQLFIYQKAIADQTGQSPIGIFYMPVNNKFSTQEISQEERYKLDGLIIDDINDVLDMDTTLSSSNLRSKLIPVSIQINKKNNEISVKKLKNTIKQEELIRLSEYAYDVCATAIGEISNNYIKPKPIKDSIFTSCSSCAYQSICKFNPITDQIRIKDKTVCINTQEDSDV